LEDFGRLEGWEVGGLRKFYCLFQTVAELAEALIIAYSHWSLSEG
jgi:hypothetical protein